MALRLALLCLPALLAAEPFPSCVQKSKKGYKEPASLQALLDCQKKKLDRFLTDHEARTGTPPSDETVERWQELQREEARDFIKRHPDRSVMEGPAQDAQAPAKKRGRADPAAAEREDLRRELGAESDGGAQGITPQMARSIVKAINKQQGYMSQEMTSLLESLQKDGPNLSDSSMRQLKEAARQADNDGIELGVSPEVKDYLLRRD